MRPRAISVISISLLLLLTGCNRKPALYQNAPVQGSRIVIPVSEVSDGNAHFYTYRKSGKRINFFVRTDLDGRVASYFDACLTCYSHKNGYRQEEAELICNECGMKFGLFDVKWEEKDGCNPIYLKNTIDNSSLVIDTAVIEKGAKLF